MFDRYFKDISCMQGYLNEKNNLLHNKKELTRSLTLKVTQSSGSRLIMM